jgi:hypothetical protein
MSNVGEHVFQQLVDAILKQEEYALDYSDDQPFDWQSSDCMYEDNSDYFGPDN